MLHILELIHDRDFPEEPTNVDLWVNKQKGVVTRRYYCYKQEAYPQLTEFDLLIIHGGDQHLWNKDKDPWLRAEVDFVKDVIEAGKPVIGFCLGSQIIAEACGGEVFLDKPGEFGFFKIIPRKDRDGHLLFDGLQDGFISFEWHSDHYRLSENVTALASTPAVPNQVIVNSKYPLVGFQFHPEFTIDMIKGFIALEKDKIWRTKEGRYIPSEQFIQYLYTVGETYALFEILINNTFAYLRKRYPEINANLPAAMSSQVY